MNGISETLLRKRSMQHDLNTTVQIMHERPESEIQVNWEDGFHCLKRQHLYEDKQLLTIKLQTCI